MSSGDSHVYEFGEFRLDVENPSLWRGSELMPIFPKSLEILVLLVRRHGEVVTREEILEAVWPDTFVEESNITYTISQLRKTLGRNGKRDAIQTVPKHGYRFVAEVSDVIKNGVPTSAGAQTGVPRQPVPWHLIGIAVVGLFFVTSFSLWWGYVRPQASSEPQAGRRAAASRPADDSEAFQAYARGRAIYDKKIPGNPEKAIDEYQKAVALDPTFALAYAGIADALSRQARNLHGDRAIETVSMAKAAANKALALDPNLAEAYASLGLIHRLHERDWINAEKNLKKAIEIDPNYAYAHLWYAQMLAMVGRIDEAESEIKRAIEIDPLTPDVKSGRLAVLETRGDYAGALALARELAGFDKERPHARRGVLTFLFHLGDYASVIDICEQDLRRYETMKWVYLSPLVTAYHRTGQTERRDEKLSQLEALAQTDSQALYALAENYAELGRHDEAMAALEKCFDAREERLQWVRAEPRFANLRADARFLAFLHKLNLPAYEQP